MTFGANSGLPWLISGFWCGLRSNGNARPRPTHAMLAILNALIERFQVFAAASLRVLPASLALYHVIHTFRFLWAFDLHVINSFRLYIIATTWFLSAFSSIFFSRLGLELKSLGTAAYRRYLLTKLIIYRFNILFDFLNSSGKQRLHRKIMGIDIWTHLIE